MITRDDYYIKLNFTDLIGQFERENGSIVHFGKDMAYGKKIERIKRELLVYTNEKLTEDEQSEDITAEPTQVSDTGA
jgi:hypothetical protein